MRKNSAQNAENPIKSNQKNFFKNRVLRTLGSLPVQLLLGLITAIWLLPTIGLFFQSLRVGSDIGQSGWWTVFENFRVLTLESYLRMLQEGGMARAFFNTFLITIPTTVLVVFLGASAGYALSWISFRGRDTLFLIVIGLLVVPTQMAFIPVAQLYRILMGGALKN